MRFASDFSFGQQTYATLATLVAHDDKSPIYKCLMKSRKETKIKKKENNPKSLGHTTQTHTHIDKKVP